jgi:hypothetical protein
MEAQRNKEEWREQLDKFLFSILDEVKRTNDSVSDVVDRLLPKWNYSAEALSYVYRIGIIKLADDLLHSIRDFARESTNGIPRSGKVQYPARFVKRVSEIQRMGANGQMKIIAEFLRIDFIYNFEIANSIIQSETKHKRWAHAGIVACDEYRVDAFKDLPRRVQEEIIALVEA